MPAIPVPDSERARWEEGERRLAMLSGQWKPVLRAALGEFFAPQVRDRIGSAVDMSRAPFKHAVEALNTLYLDPPTVSAADADLSPLSPDTLWPIRDEAQRVVIGLGECLVRWDYVDQPTPRLVQRLVLPNRCEVIANPRDQHEIWMVRETMTIPLDTGGWMILRETHDTRENRVPFLVERWDDQTGWQNVTAEQTRDLDDGVPYRDAAGQIVPYSLHHQTLGSHTWSWCEWAELVDAQLHAGCLQTWLLAGIRDNAYPTRVTVDLDMPTGAVVPEGDAARGTGSAYILIEPSTILRLKTSPTAQGVGTVTTLPATMNIQETSLAAAGYVEQALQDAGLGPADEAPAKGVSGHAITISREALRRSQKRQIPPARLGDQRMLALGARLANRYLGASLPTDPAAYSLTYHGIPLSTAEVQSAVDRVTRLLDAGLMTRAMALREVYPQLAPAEAERLAAQLDERAMPPSPPDVGEPADAVEVPEAVDATTSPEVAAVVATGAAVQDTALNGAQVTALVEVLAQIAAGTLAPDAAILLITSAFPAIDEAAARRMVAAQGRLPSPAPPAPTTGE